MDASAPKYGKVLFLSNFAKHDLAVYHDHFGKSPSVKEVILGHHDDDLSHSKVLYFVILINEDQSQFKYDLEQLLLLEQRL
jgi:hypothetical protein